MDPNRIGQPSFAQQKPRTNPPHLTRPYMEMMKAHALRLQELDNKYRCIFFVNSENPGQSQGSAQYGIRGSGSASARHVATSARKSTTHSHRGSTKERTMSCAEDSSSESQGGSHKHSRLAKSFREPSLTQLVQVEEEDNEEKFVTLDWILENLLSQETDPSFIQDFVLTMNLFMTPEELLAILKRKFDEPVPPDVPASQIKEYIKTVQNQTKIRILLIIEKWVDATWNASTDPMLVSAVRNFVDAANMKVSSPKINRLVDKKIANEEAKTMTLFQKDTPPPRVMPFIEIDTPKPSVSIFTISAIKSWEFQDLNFTKKDKSLAPNIHAFIKHFNMMSSWFARTVLSCTSLPKRVRAIELLIDLAEAFLQLNNFNGLLVVISTLLSSSIFRLKLSWNAISRNHKARMKEYTDLSSNSKNFSDLRNRMKTITGPCVPYIGLFQTDLTFIEEGNPTKVDGNIINWNKCKLQASVIRRINEYRMNAYNFAAIPWMQEYFMSIEIVEDEDELWERSTALESRADIQNSKLSQDTDQRSASPAVSSPSKHQKTRSTASGNSSQLGAHSDTLGATNEGQGGMINVSIPGFTSFFETPYPDTVVKEGEVPTTGLALKEYIFTSILNRLPKSKLRSIIEGLNEKRSELTLVEFSALNPYGREIADDERYSIRDAPGLNFVSFFTYCCPVQVVYGKSSAVILAELESPLHPLISAICSSFGIANTATGGNGGGNDGSSSGGGGGNNNAASNGGKESNEFALLMCNKDNHPKHWLNRNVSLRRQGFKESYKIYVYPTSLLTEREVNKSEFMHNLSCKSGYLKKANVRPLMRYGLLPRSGLSTASSLSSQSGAAGQSGGLASSTRSSQMRQPYVVIPPPSESPRVDGLLAVSGRQYSSSSMLASASSARSSASSVSMGSSYEDEGEEATEKNWFLAVDGFLFYFKDFASPRPRRVFLLEYYNVTLGTLSGGQLCIILRLRPDYPFRVKESRTVLLTSKNEAELRAWYADLRHRSCICRHSKIFGVPQSEVSLRCSSTTFIPKQIQACINKIFMYGPGVEGLFTSALPSLSSLERVKDGLDAGEVPESHSTTELGIIAQALLSYFAELPEPIFTQDMVAALAEGADTLAVLNGWLAGKISQAHAFALMNLLLMLSTWNDSMPSGSKRQGAAVLCQYMPGPEKKTVKLAEDLLRVAGQAVIPPERCDFKAYVKTLPPPMVLQSSDSMFILSKEEGLLVSRLISTAFSKGSYKASTSFTSGKHTHHKKGGDGDASSRSGSFESPSGRGARKSSMSDSETDSPGFMVLGSEQADEAISMHYEMYSTGSSIQGGGGGHYY